MRFLFVDRILQSTPGEYIRGIKHVTSDDHYLCRSKNGQLYLTPSFIGEALGQLAAWNVMARNEFTLRPVAGVVASAQLSRPAFVGETLELESYIDSVDDVAVRYNSEARIGDDVVFRIHNALGPLLPMDEFIDKATVEQQYNEINRPGSWPPVYQEKVDSSVSLVDANAINATNLMIFDRVLICEPGQFLVAEKRINRAASYFPDHFPRKPVLPMSVLLECKLNIAEYFLKQSHFSEDYRIIEMRRIKMNDFVYPGDILVCTMKVKMQEEGKLILTYKSEVDGKRVCVLDVVLSTTKGPI